MHHHAKRRSFRVFKLTPVDKQTLFWLMDNNPEEIKSWTKFIAWEYRRLDKVKLDSDKLYEEIKPELTSLPSE